MRKLIISILLLASMLSAVGLSWAGDITTVYLIRHTEKDLTIKQDPPLTNVGALRAQRWAELFAKIELAAIYSTDTKRTRATAAPTATSQAKTIQIYSPSSIDHQALISKHRGETILVVGHSNTTPQFVNKLIGEQRYQDIDESEHNRLYQVTAVGAHRHSQLLLVNPKLD